MRYGIEKAYFINLEIRLDRWNKILNQLPKLGITAERFQGYHINPGWEGCLMSHLEILKMCQKYQRFMIIEDDMLIQLDQPTLILDKVFDQLPPDWDMLYLGANLMKDIKSYSSCLYRLKGAFCTHAIIYNNPDMVKKIIQDLEARPYRIDVYFRDEIQEKYKVFIPYPMIATQADGVSNITRSNQTYEMDMIENYFNHLLP